MNEVIILNAYVKYTSLNYRPIILSVAHILFKVYF